MFSGDKSYTFDYCPKSFSNKGNVINQTKIHAGCKNFPCDKCPKLFWNMKDLNNHFRHHSGEN